MHEYVPHSGAVPPRGGWHHGWNNLSNRLAGAGRGEAALVAIREAAELIEPYARRFPEGQYGKWGKVIQRKLKEMEGQEAPDESAS